MWDRELAAQSPQGQAEQALRVQGRLAARAMDNTQFRDLLAKRETAEPERASAPPRLGPAARAAKKPPGRAPEGVWRGVSNWGLAPLGVKLGPGHFRSQTGAWPLWNQQVHGTTLCTLLDDSAGNGSFVFWLRLDTCLRPVAAAVQAGRCGPAVALIAGKCTAVCPGFQLVGDQLQSTGCPGYCAAEGDGGHAVLAPCGDGGLGSWRAISG